MIYGSKLVVETLQLYKHKATSCQLSRKVWRVKSGKLAKDPRDVFHSAKKIFMSHAAMSPLPKPAIQAVQKFTREFSETGTIREDPMSQRNYL